MFKRLYYLVAGWYWWLRGARTTYITANRHLPLDVPFELARTGEVFIVTAADENGFKVKRIG